VTLKSRLKITKSLETEPLDSYTRLRPTISRVI